MTLPLKTLENLGLVARVVAALLGLLGVIVAAVAAELYVNDGYTESWRVKALKSFVTISTFLLLLCLAAKHYSAFISGLRARSQHTTEYTLHRRDRIAHFLCEVIICCIHTPPGISGQWWSAVAATPVCQSIDGTISVVMTARAYLIFPLLRDVMKFNTATATMIARYNEVTFDTAFALRALLALYPLRAIAALICLVFLVISYALRTFERGACEDPLSPAPWCDDSGAQDFSKFHNALWATVITSLTVGYGDIYPRTFPGRLVAVIAAFSGIILIALLVSTVTSHVELQLKHRNALEVLKQHHFRRGRRVAAGRVVFQFLLLNRRNARRSAGAARPVESKHSTLQEVNPYAPSGSATPSQTGRRVTNYALALALRKWRQLKSRSTSNTSDDSMSLLLHEMKQTNNSVTSLAAEVAAMRLRQAELDTKMELLVAACLDTLQQCRNAAKVTAITPQEASLNC